jgi:ATP adenylyltransferase
MDRLWSPWRYKYITESSANDACIFCVKPAQGNDRENLIVYRGERNFVILNAYPYTNGHLMIAPYEHVASLNAARADTVTEMMLLTREAERHIRDVYRPHGLNLGMNLGEAAGAGIAGHIHMHVLPRWRGDANFLSVIGETRVLPETLDITYDKLKASFEADLRG